LSKRTSEESSQDNVRVKRDTANENCKGLNKEKLRNLFESFNFVRAVKKGRL